MNFNTDESLTFIVKSDKRKRKSIFKEISLKSGEINYKLPLSACVHHGDKIVIIDNKLFVVCKNGYSQIFPIYSEKETLSCDGIETEFLIKEITEKEEYDAYQSLTEYHYRGNSIYGQTAVLILRNFDPSYPRILGYIELATPLYMNKARSKILNDSFCSGNISWDNWDMEATRQYINIIARISRCVIYPEFRGLGLGQILIKHAINFANSHWQIAGLCPLFLEISADMIKYVPFAKRAGMTYIGNTEGNLQRVSKDMEYLLKNSTRIESSEIIHRGSCGIVDTQRARLNRVFRLIENNDVNRDEIINRLKKLSKEEVLKDYSLFHEIISLPKPNYMIGLNPEAEEFLKKRVSEINPSYSYESPKFNVDTLERSINIKGLSVSYKSKVRRTKRTHIVQQAFGISPDEINSEIIRDLSIEIKPGEIILLVGPSGCGKTTFLEILERAFNKNIKDNFPWELEGELEFPSNYIPSSFKPTKSEKPLIEIFNDLSVSESLYLMSLVGLSDAFIYLKRYKELSKGQQYRIMLALMIASQSNVWLLDEFCTNLDSASAKAVAIKLQKLSRNLNVAVVAAAPYCENFVHALKPDKVIQMKSTWEVEVLNGKDFIDCIKKSTYKKTIPSLNIKPEFMGKIYSGKKCTTIRKGTHNINKGLLLLENKNESAVVYVTETIYKKFNELTEIDAINDGFESLEELKKTLKRIYPSIKDKSNISIIRFKLPFGKDNKEDISKY